MASLGNGCLGAREQAVGGHAEHGRRPDDAATAFIGGKSPGEDGNAASVFAQIRDKPDDLCTEVCMCAWHAHNTRSGLHTDNVFLSPSVKLGP